MGEEEKNEPITFPKLRFPFLPLSSAATHSPDHHHQPPPLETQASVPFKWEEQPGKPRPCTDIITVPEPGSGPAKLPEPPPCRLMLLADSGGGRITKMPSPTTVLDGPYVYSVVRPRFSSFRLFREPFDGGGDSPRGSVDGLVGDGGAHKRKGFLGRGLRFKGDGRLMESGRGSLGFSSPASAEGKLKRNGSFTSLSQPASPRLSD
ncbi:hypothetical protein STAS_13722 [Striga asiatica]|uniref:Uncharacterized protein n=1 Tax=Striga asiatica TaxID=4170 RepID=A0A5A7PXA3_STRAF|nr:hypothetical protein STAS_13722 [Striga asiatica]